MEYILENEKLKVTISSAGAELISVVHKEDGTEHIWQADKTLWGRHAPILFPHTGMVKDGQFSARGRTCKSPQHGFARDMEHSLLSAGVDELALELVSDDRTRVYWPYDFRMVSFYRIEGDALYHSIRIENPGEEEISFGIGYHPAFAIPFDDKHTYEDYEFRFDRAQSPLCLEQVKGLISGSTYPLGVNIKSIPLTQELFANDSHCMVNLSAKTLGIYEKDTGRAVVCDIADFPYTLIWSKPGKPQFVCIEPWHSIPDRTDSSGNWEEKPAAAVLEPGEHFTARMKLTFVR